MNQQAAHSMYYVAVLCPPEIDKQILEYKRWMKERFGCVVALKSPAHITLIPPFWLEEEKEAMLQQTCTSFTCELPELTIGIHGFSHFNKKVLHAVVAGNPVIEELKKLVEVHFVSSFDIIKKDERPFHPHITIATRDLKPSDFIRAWDYFSKKEFTASFASQTISLLKLSEDKWKLIKEKNW